MKINFFLKKIYGRKLYFQIAFAMLLALGTTIAQFLAAQHLGNVIDAIEKGYEETMYHVLAIAASLEQPHLLFSAAKFQQHFHAAFRLKSE